jgi:hypothetical protein
MIHDKMFRKDNHILIDTEQIDECETSSTPKYLLQVFTKPLFDKNTLFLEFIQRIIAVHPLLYSQDGTEGEVEFGGSFTERWGWYQSFITISRELKIRISDVGKEPLFESLTLLSYLIDESKEEARRLKQTQQK